MRFYCFAILGSAVLLSACSSAYRDSSATSALPSAARVAPQLSTGATFGRIGVKSLSCAQLTAEDQRLAAIGMSARPSTTEMIAQQRLLDVRNALFTRCSTPARSVQNRPLITAPLKSAVAKVAPTPLPTPTPASVPMPKMVDYNKQMASLTASSKSPPRIETQAPVKEMAALPAPATTTVTTTGSKPQIEVRNITTSSSTKTTSKITPVTTGVSEIVTTGGEHYKGRQFKTIVADGDDVRVTTVSYDDLPFISGPELQ